MYYSSSENKGADQLRSYCEADLRLRFPIGKIRFSHDAVPYNVVQRFVTRMYRRYVSQRYLYVFSSVRRTDRDLELNTDRPSGQTRRYIANNQSCTSTEAVQAQKQATGLKFWL